MKFSDLYLFSNIPHHSQSLFAWLFVRLFVFRAFFCSKWTSGAFEWQVLKWQCLWNVLQPTCRENQSLPKEPSPHLARSHFVFKGRWKDKLWRKDQMFASDVSRNLERQCYSQCFLFQQQALSFKTHLLLFKYCRVYFLLHLTGCSFGIRDQRILQQLSKILWLN